MSKRLVATVVLAAVAGFGSAAEARVDNGPVLSRYELNDRPITRPELSRNFKSGSKTYARKKTRYSSTRKRQRTARASRGHGHGGGASRSCLQPAARALLGRIEAQFGPVSIVSTCRPGAVIATSGKPSKHRYGLAIDFDAGSRKSAVVAWLRANHTSGGTMTYRDMSHIHVDIGYRFVKLGANSGRG